MAQTTVLASGTTAATSSDIVVAAGASKTVGIFGAAALAGLGSLKVMLDTPGADIEVTRLTRSQPVVVLSGPGTFRVVRALSAVAVGVFVED